jgi:tripartite-type tricarboxylate transporter receptor subunit TctC
LKIDHPSRRLFCSAAASVLLAPLAVRAQSAYPSRPVRIVVPFGPGSGADTFARFVSEPMSRVLGQPVIVENKAGADGIIGTQEVARAPADGHTLLLGSNSTLAFNPAVRPDLPYKTQDFRAIYGLNRGAAVIVVPAGSPLHSIADLVAEAKKRPDKVTIANYSPALQMAAAWFAGMLGTSFVHVPYKGAAPLMTDMVGGQIPLAIADASAVVTQVQAGKLRALAVAGTERLASMPDVPTTREAGFPEFAHYSWIALFAPAATPDPVVRRLERLLADISVTPEFAARIEKSSGIPMRMNSEQLADWVTGDAARYQKLVKVAGIQQAR